MAVDAHADVLGDLAFQQLRRTAGELDHLETARHLAAGVGDDLAVLGADDHGELLGMGLDEVAQAVQEPRAVQRRRRRPSRERSAGGCDSGIDLGGTRELDFGGLGAGRGVEHRRGTAAPDLDGLAADDMRYLFQGVVSSGNNLSRCCDCKTPRPRRRPAEDRAAV